MKNYDLSQYMLREKDIIIFPLTKDEVGILKQSTDQFSSYIKLPYVASKLSNSILDEIMCETNMENDYWFLDTLWVVTHTKTKEIFGTIRLKQQENENRIIQNLTLMLDYVDACSDALNLFAKFLSVNNYNNLVLDNEEILTYEQENV